jgi:hypothetical protein
MPGPIACVAAGTTRLLTTVGKSITLSTQKQRHDVSDGVHRHGHKATPSPLIPEQLRRIEHRPVLADAPEIRRFR